MNVELLQQVKAYILAEPRRLDMSVVMATSEKAPCGSAGCIDGWAQYLNAKLLATKGDGKTPADFIPRYDPDYTYGRDILDISEREADRLFTPPEIDGDCYMVGDTGERWPDDLIDRYVVAKTDKQRAQITAERIDRFIASDGAE